VVAPPKKEARMSDDTRFSEVHTDEQQPHHPKHRRDDVPVDGGGPDLGDLREFGENPDTELAG
jgi:hypothetical protein